LDLEKFIKASHYTFAVNKVGGGIYEVVFKWRKFGITRYYKVKMRIVKAGETSVVYESTEDSDYYMKFSFKLEPVDGETRVEISSEMKAGLMADLLGRKDYASFIEELVDKGLASLAQSLAQSLGVSKGAIGSAGVSCRNCLLYDSITGRCVFLGVEVRDHLSPPCKGEDFIDAGLVKKKMGG
jgi:carbon monoxide dehydrogenase subunit G